MNIVAWAIFGILTGVIVLFLDPESQREGVFGPLLLGIVGSIMGGVVANVAFGIGLSTLTLHTFSIAAAGSLILLFLGRLIKQV